MSDKITRKPEESETSNCREDSPQRGGILVEQVLLIALVALTAIPAMGSLGTRINCSLNASSAALSSPSGSEGIPSSNFSADGCTVAASGGGGGSSSSSGGGGSSSSSGGGGGGG